MKPLRIERFGDEVQGIRLGGDPAKCPEPTHVRVVFPGGDVDIARCEDGSYWVHVRVNRPEDAEVVTGDAVAGRLVGGRADVRGRAASDCDPGDIAHPDLEHVAIRVARAAREQAR